jgi:hypothetical protein
MEDIGIRPVNKSGAESVSEHNMCQKRKCTCYNLVKVNKVRQGPHCDA